MIYPSCDQMQQFVDSRFALVRVISKRAKQLHVGARRLIETKSEHPITIAMEELCAGKYNIRQTPKEKAC